MGWSDRCLRHYLSICLRIWRRRWRGTTVSRPKFEPGIPYKKPEAIPLQLACSVDGHDKKQLSQFYLEETSCTVDNPVVKKEGKSASVLRVVGKWLSQTSGQDDSSVRGWYCPQKWLTYSSTTHKEEMPCEKQDIFICVFRLTNHSTKFDGTEWHKKKGTLEKPNKNWRNPRKKNYWQKLNHYNLHFKRQ